MLDASIIEVRWRYSRPHSRAFSVMLTVSHLGDHACSEHRQNRVLSNSIIMPMGGPLTLTTNSVLDRCWWTGMEATRLKLRCRPWSLATFSASASLSAEGAMLMVCQLLTVCDHVVGNCVGDSPGSIAACSA